MAALVRETPPSAARSEHAPAPHQARPQLARLASLPACDDRPHSSFPMLLLSPFPTANSVSRQASQHVTMLTRRDSFGSAEVAAVAWPRGSWWEAQP